MGAVIAMERAMKLRGILRAMSGELSWLQAADSLGDAPAQSAAPAARQQRVGYDGLLDRRSGQGRSDRLLEDADPAELLLPLLD